MYQNSIILPRSNNNKTKYKCDTKISTEFYCSHFSKIQYSRFALYLMAKNQSGVHFYNSLFSKCKSVNLILLLRFFFLSRISFFFKKIPLLWIIHTFHISIKYAIFFLKTINDVVSFKWNLDKFTREKVVFSVFKYAKMTFKYSMLVFLKNKCNLFSCFLGFNEIWEYHIVLFFRINELGIYIP